MRLSIDAEILSDYRYRRSRRYILNTFSTNHCWIRIHKAPENGSNPGPQHWYKCSGTNSHTQSHVICKFDFFWHCNPILFMLTFFQNLSTSFYIPVTGIHVTVTIRIRKEKSVWLTSKRMQDADESESLLQGIWRKWRQRWNFAIGLMVVDLLIVSNNSGNQRIYV